MAGWPYTAQFHIFASGDVITHEALNAQQLAAMGLYAGNKPVNGVVLSDDTGWATVTRPGSGEAKPFVYLPDAPTTRRLVAQWKIGTGVWAREYQLLNGGSERTYNAAWNPNTLEWSLDDGGKVAMSVRHVQTSTVATTYQLKKDAASSAWSDGSWDEVLRVDRSGGAYAADFVARNSFQLTGGGGYPRHAVYSAAVQTTDGTSTDIFLFTMPNNGAAQILFKAIGLRSDHAKANSYIIHSVLRSSGGIITGLGSNATFTDVEEDATWGGATAAGSIGAVAYFDVQGKAATTINWVATIEVTMVQ